MIPILQSAGKSGTSNDAKEQYIASMFTGTTRGGWYDPSDLNTMFQDKNGTTPVTGLNQKVGLILDKSQGLILGAEQFSNNSFDLGATNWNGGSPFTAAPISNFGNITAGKFDINFNATPSTSVSMIYQQGQFNLEPQQWYKLEFKLGSYDQGGLLFLFENGLASVNSTNLSSNGTYTQYLFVSSVIDTDTFTSVIIKGITSSTGSCKFTLEYVSLKKIPGNHLISEIVGSADRRPTLKGTPNYLEFNESVMTSVGFITETTTETSRKYATISAGLDCSSTLQGSTPALINFYNISFGRLPIVMTPAAFFQLVLRYGPNKDQGYAVLGKARPIATGVNSGNFNLVSLGGYKLVWQSVVDYTQTTTAALKIKINNGSLVNSSQLVNATNLNTYFNRLFSLVLGYDVDSVSFLNVKLYSLIIVGQTSDNTRLTNILDYINSKMPP